MSGKESTASKSSQKETTKNRDVTSSVDLKAIAPPGSLSMAALQRAMAEPQRMGPADVLGLQRLGGNRNVMRLLTKRIPQAKLNAGPQHDTYAQEAERVAAQEMTTPELSHTIQQGSSAARQIQRNIKRLPGGAHFSAAGAVIHATPGLSTVLQRHSSWEHKLLGDADPRNMATIGAWQDLIAQTELDAESKKDKTRVEANKTKEATIHIEDVGDIKKGDVMHVLVQEMDRLLKWQANPPASTADNQGLKAQSDDPEYQVRLVKLPGGNGNKDAMIITYGELNTLADFYGDVETMKTADPKQRNQIVQSVRKETYLRLREIYEKVEKSLTRAEKTSTQDARAEFNRVNKKYKWALRPFKGANSPDFVSGMAGQVNLLAGDKALIGQGTGAKGELNKYSATLARNACHFVPESWHSWAIFHAEALRLAGEAYTKRQQLAGLQVTFQNTDYSRRPLDKNEMSSQIMILQRQIDNLENEALLNNGFGDHYLQDSYAAGHLINKTQIMQWYIEYIDSSDEWDYFKDENWRKVQQMAYGQPGLANPDQYDKTKVKGHTPGGPENQARNPQAVENMPGDDWMVRFRALGLQVPQSLQTRGSDTRQLVQQLQKRALTTSREISATQLLAGKSRAEQERILKAMSLLIHDGIVRMDIHDNQERGRWMKNGLSLDLVKVKHYIAHHDDDLMFILREDYVPKEKNAAKFEQSIQKGGKGEESYQRMAAAVTYGDYEVFMRSSFLQKSTNALHDVFCKNGLKVVTGGGGAPFKVYGDDSMFNANSSEGVKLSTETSNMSRDAIIGKFTAGNEGANTTSAILTRLPEQVVAPKPDGSEGSQIDFATWHNPSHANSLKTYCFDKVFPEMAWKFTQKLVVGASSDLGMLHKDEQVHSGEKF